MTHEEMAAPIDGSRRDPTRLDRFTALAVLTLFAVTWPVLGLLGNNAEFFLARRSSKLEIALLALALTVVVPALLGLVGSLPGRYGMAIGAGMIALLGSLLAFLYMRKLPLPLWVALTLATGAGVAATWAYFRFDSARQITRYLLAVPLVFLLVFVFATPSGAVLLDSGSEIGAPAPVGNPMPIVVLVFDEFPVASLIDGDGELRADRYPNLARLAGEGTWFRNAVTVEQQTEHSLPAILTGTVPDPSATPFAGQFPNNLFTALQGAYDLHVHETITQMCPISLCETTVVASTSIARDVGIVAGHVLLPDVLGERLPDIDRSWGDFGAVSDIDMRAEFRELLGVDPRLPIARLIEDITGYRGQRPPFFFLHMLIPHHPWQLLPDGRRYPLVEEGNPAAVAGGWGDDEFLVAQTLQRHLLQVGYADHVVGQLIAALEREGLYEGSLLVVVADHGVSIKPGVPHQRIITESTIGDIAAVPLFVKAPGLAGGVVDDRRALTTDVVPTIADAIDARLSWDVDGASLLGPAPDRGETTTFGTEGPVTFGVDGGEKLESARRIEALFPDGDPWRLRPEGSPDLLFAEVDVATLPDSSVTARLKRPLLYEAVDTDADSIPVRVAGRLSGSSSGDEVLAVIVNGMVGAMTRVYEHDDELRFLAVFPPELLDDGHNEITLAEVTNDGRLLRIDQPASDSPPDAG